MKKSTSWLLISYSASLSFLVIFFALHFIKPEIDPSWNFISEYEIGRWGWLMQIAFILLAFGCIGIAIGIWRRINLVGKVGLIMLSITATGMLIGGIFKTDPLNTAADKVTQHGQTHQLGAMLDRNSIRCFTDQHCNLVKKGLEDK